MDVCCSVTRVRGFSVIELLITLGLGIILFAAGIPTWHHLQAHIRLDNAQKAYARLFHLARNTAIQRRLPIVLCPSTDGRQCHRDYRRWQDGALLFVDTDSDGKHDHAEPALAVQQAITGVVIQSSKRRLRVRFRTNGDAAGSNLSLRFCSPVDPTLNRALILSGSGRLRSASHLPGSLPVACTE